MQKLYLLLAWMNDVVRNPRILDAVEDVLGPDILCWQSSFFIKEPGSKGYVSWHQDATYWGLSTPDVCTAWVALTPATIENGAMKVAPGTHKLPQMAHEDTFNPDNLLTRGQELKANIDIASAVDMVLAPGEISLHHIMLAHASEPNRSTDRRMGLAIRYIAPHVRQTTGVPDSAMLVRGKDRYGHFEMETPAAGRHASRRRRAAHPDHRNAPGLHLPRHGQGRPSVRPARRRSPTLRRNA